MRVVGVVFSVLGGFLIGFALLAWLYLPGRLMVTPIDVDSTTRLSGEATLGDDTFPVKATSRTKTDSEASDEDVAVWVNSSCLVRDAGDVPDCVSADDPQERLISASVDNFATDRRTALAVNDPEYLPADAEPHAGLINKWPFEAEQRVYPYWDGTAGEAVDARFDGEDSIDGLDVYRYVIEVDEAPVELTDGVLGTYSSSKTVYIEPLTGAIIDQVDQQERVTDEGENFLTLDLAFTEEQVAENVASAKSNVRRLELVTETAPVIAAVAGLPLLLIGTLLILRTRSREEHEERVLEPVG